MEKPVCVFTEAQRAELLLRLNKAIAGGWVHWWCYCSKGRVHSVLKTHLLLSHVTILSFPGDKEFHSLGARGVYGLHICNSLVLGLKIISMSRLSLWGSYYTAPSGISPSQLRVPLLCWHNILTLQCVGSTASFGWNSIHGSRKQWFETPKPQSGEQQKTEKFEFCQLIPLLESIFGK